MSVKVVRFYETDNDDPEDMEDFWMSVIADESSVSYVFPTDGSVSGLDDDRIESLVAAYNDGKNPETPEAWIDLASIRVSGTVYDGPEYASIDEAIKSEIEILNESLDLRKGFNDPEYLDEVFGRKDIADSSTPGDSNE